MPLTYKWTDIALMAGAKLAQPGETSAGRFVVDSRLAEAGDVFVALPGERRDGHEFLPEVFKRGVSGVLVSKKPKKVPAGVAVLLAKDVLAALQSLAAAHRDKCPAKVIGITGSNGKTTTKEMLAHLLRAGGHRVLATRGNLNSRIGMPLMLLEADRSHTHLVLEMGASAKGDIKALAGLAKPQVGVITSIGRAHLEFFKTVDGVAAAKWELVESLPPSGIAFLNMDDARLREKRPSAKCPVVGFGTGPGLDVRAENLRQDPQVTFDLAVGGARREIRLPISGLFNVTNALAACAVALWERVPLAVISSAMIKFTPPDGRMQIRRRPDGSLFLLDAYNANPDSMAASLDSFVKAYGIWPCVAVLGSMLELGPHAEKEHRALGRLLADLPLAKVFFVGKEARWVKEGYGEKEGAPLLATEDPEEVRRGLAAVLNSETVVLFKGSRGARLEDIYEPLSQG